MNTWFLYCVKIEGSCWCQIDGANYGLNGRTLCTKWTTLTQNGDLLGTPYAPDNIAHITLYLLTRPKLSFGGYLTIESTF